MDRDVLHNLMEGLLPLIVIPTLIISFAWVIGLIVNTFKNRSRLRAQVELQNKLLDKFDSAEELTAYLKSDAAKIFFSAPGSEPTTLLNKILGSIRIGVILALLGAGFFILLAIAPSDDARFVLTIIGVISFMTGAGFLISALISYRLAKTLGVMLAEKLPDNHATIQTVP